MIEVHLMRLESPGAIGARNATQVPQEIDHARLPNPHPLQLELSISAVILDVVGSLAGAGYHTS